MWPCYGCNKTSCKDCEKCRMKQSELFVLWVKHKNNKHYASGWYSERFGDLVVLYLKQWPYDIRKHLRATIEDDRGNVVVKSMNRYVMNIGKGGTV